MKISHYILLSFLFILALFSITTYINHSLSISVIDNEEYLSKSTIIVKDGGRFQRNILTMVSGLRGYLLTGERSFIESYDSANSENDSILTELSSAVTDSSQNLLLKKIKQLNDQWTDEYTEPLKQAKRLASVSRENLDKFNLFYKEKFATGHENAILLELKEKFRLFNASEYELRLKKMEKLSASVKKTGRLSLLLTALSILSALSIIIFLLLKISRRIGQMSDMANKIAAGNYGVSISEKGNDELTPLVHSLNHMAAELTKNISLLEQTNAELDQFAHVVSHDLKGPLRGISNVISWIEEDHDRDLTDKLREYMEIIRERINRAESLIEGLLTYARADREEMEKEVVDVNSLVDEILKSLPGHGRIRVEVDNLPVFKSEKLLLFQVFSNLIGNAIKYNDKPNGQVLIYCQEYPAHYEFFIRDNGIGIAEAYLEKIFVIFQTLNDGDSFEGAGVGLAIVKKIIDSKKQRIGVRSQPGIGSLFSFTWPKN